MQRRTFNIRKYAYELSDKEFIRLFRVNKRISRDIIDIVSEYQNEPSRTSALDITTQVGKFIKYFIVYIIHQMSPTYISVIKCLFLLQVLTATRFMASGSYRMDIGHNIYTAISQPSVSRCLANVTKALNQLQVVNKWVMSYELNVLQLWKKLDV